MLALYSVTVGLPSLIAYTLAKRYKQAWRSKSSWLNYPSPLPDLILMVALFTGQGRKHLSQAAARDGGELLRRIIVRAVTSLLLLPPASCLSLTRQPSASRKLLALCSLPSRQLSVLGAAKGLAVCAIG